VTVQGEAAIPAPGEAQFTDLFARYYNRLVWYIRVRLDDRHADFAEDLTQETFLRLWQYYSAKGKPGSYTLLTLQARSRIAAFYETRAATERATDFADPMNTPLTAGAGTFAIGRPEVAPLVHELEDAMEQMTRASQAWRDQHKAAFAIRGRIDKTTKPKAIARLQAEYAAAVRRGDRLLAAFRDSCLRVGQLRAEIETAAGPRWNASSSGPDAIDERAKTPGSLKSDPTVTHCPAGHRMDLENTNFSEDGARRCRTCKAQQARDWHSARGSLAGASR
jgi:DNA-directed RNA polymerase specialized sigma24 family protein